MYRDPSDWVLSSQRIISTSQFSIISKLAEDTFKSCIQFIYKNIAEPALELGPRQYHQWLVSSHNIAWTCLSHSWIIYPKVVVRDGIKGPAKIMSTAFLSSTSQVTVSQEVKLLRRELTLLTLIWMQKPMKSDLTTNCMVVSYSRKYGHFYQLWYQVLQ